MDLVDSSWYVFTIVYRRYRDNPSPGKIIYSKWQVGRKFLALFNYAVCDQNFFLVREYLGYKLSGSNTIYKIASINHAWSQAMGSIGLGQRKYIYEVY